MVKSFKLLAATALLATAAASCSSDGCTDNGSSIPLAGFYSASSKSSVTLSNVTVRGIEAPGDSILAKNESLSQIHLPLRVSTVRASYEFTFNGGGTDVPATIDTLVIHYSPKSTFVSKDCGAMYNFKIEDWFHTCHAIDSISIADVITNSNAVAIKIYMKD